MAISNLESLNTLTFLPDRNRLAMARTSEMDFARAVRDAFIGGLGGFIPGMKAVTFVATMSMQVPVYQSLVTDLGRIYTVPPNQLTKSVVTEGTVVGSVAKLPDEFGMNFLKEIAPDLVKECGIKFIIASAPGIAITAGAWLDFAITATMIWRVGTMASIYFQNGHQWVQNRKATYMIAKDLTFDISSDTNNRVNFNIISEYVPQVNAKQVEIALELILRIRKMQPKATEQFLRETMVAQGLPLILIDDAIRHMRDNVA